MKKAFYFVLITAIFTVGIIFIPSTPPLVSPDLQKEDSLCQSTASSIPSGTTVSFIKSGVPSHFEPTVYTTKTGKKYHCAKSCRGLLNANEIYETPLKEAKKKRLSECLKCY